MKIQAYITILFVVSLMSCGILSSDNKEIPLEPGLRNYTWEIDTLYSPPGGFVYDIWGSSPNDVWAVVGTGLNTLWHYNGEEWSAWPERVSPSLYSIYGFAQNDVWMGGNDGKLYHFDGKQWEVSYQYNPSEFRNPYITDVWANSPTKIYAIGSAQPDQGSSLVSFILYFDGTEWEELYITDFEVQFQRLRIEKETLFIQAYKPAYDGNDTLLVYQFKNGILKKDISTTKSESRAISIDEISNQIYYYTGTTISKLKRDKFEEFLRVPEVEEIVRIDGRHEKDLFIHSWGVTYHYNGDNLQPILEGLISNVFRAQLFSDEVFFVILDFTEGTNYIYHGKLIKERD